MVKEANNRHNKNFIQIYRPFIDEIAEMGQNNPCALKVFLFICKNMDYNNALCVSMKTMGEILGYTRQSLSNAVSLLKEKGWICVLKTGSSNVYIINPKIVWTSYDNQKKYCKFETNVIVSPSENAEYLQDTSSSNKYKHIDESFIEAIRGNKAEKKII